MTASPGVATAEVVQDIFTDPACATMGTLSMQGSDKVKKLHAVVATQAQKYIASMFEVHSEVGQLKDNLREQHRIWLDFYSTVFHVSMLCHCICVGFDSSSMHPVNLQPQPQPQPLLHQWAMPARIGTCSGNSILLCYLCLTCILT